MTDELRRDTLGCYDHPLVRTPNIDALAAEGLRFDNAYTPSPICVPARSAIATGRYVHQTRCWSNAQPYAGQLPSWHHRLRAAGRDVTSIGKLHFRSAADDNGFTEELAPLHVVGGEGWVHGLLRDRDDVFDATGFATHIGPGDDGYSRYDRSVCDLTEKVIAARGDTPFALYVSFLRPHYPLTCPPAFYDLYDPAEMPLPRRRQPGDGTDHPVLRHMARACAYDAPFTDETRRIAVASYLGLCSLVDDLVGRIVRALKAAGEWENTVILFTSDHGECLGDRGFWTKMVMYEEAAAVPLILCGPGIPQGVRRDPVSLIDIYPTVLELAGVAAEPLPHARSLLAAPEPERAILSEYHDYGAPTGMFMLRHGRWKLVAYPGHASHLFDLETDPGETRDLAPDPAFGTALSDMTRRLAEMLDTDEVNRMAFADQAQRIAELGGEAGILARQNYDHTPVDE